MHGERDFQDNAVVQYTQSPAIIVLYINIQFQDYEAASISILMINSFALV